MEDKRKPLYITTTLPYVNSDPHIGFALEIVQADTFARYKKQTGFEVFFNTGTDEHGVKIFNKAKESGKETQAYVDEYAEKFKGLKNLLGLCEDIHFIRTTDESHKKSAQEFWRICDKNGFIYKKNYKIKYCVGCELEKTDSELEDGRCVLHPKQEIENIDEENYFFKFSAFQDNLLNLYKENQDFVVPSFRMNEIKAFVERGLTDFSISRKKEKMPWGVPVPGDDDHVMYVWFDALVNYISTIGWPHDMDTFNKWWPVIQFAGKDNLRQQSAMWQAMLMSVGLPPSRQIVIHGFITSGGVKMSKSLGNVIDPIEVVKEYGTDALRYYLLRHVSPFEDSDFTMEKFKETYNADLANGLGNFVSRVMKMVISYDIDYELNNTEYAIDQDLESFNYNASLERIWKIIKEGDESIASYEPFKKIKIEPEKTREFLIEKIGQIKVIADLLEPLLPETSNKIKGILESKSAPTEPIFPRKD